VALVVDFLVNLAFLAAAILFIGLAVIHLLLLFFATPSDNTMHSFARVLSVLFDVLCIICGAIMYRFAKRREDTM
jgi:membrane protein YdbS with pleckstrin-like domain